MSAIAVCKNLGSLWGRCVGNPTLCRSHLLTNLPGTIRRSAFATDTASSACLNGGKDESTPLGSYLARQIMFSGPIPVSQFMNLCLTHPQYGYYTTQPSVLGSEGDFVTAPEVSQVFGEMLAVWIANVAKQMQCPSGFALAELGPGKGTLMNDILRSLRTLGHLPAEVHLVEASTVLRKAQKEVLAPLASNGGIPLRWHSSLKQVPDCTADFGMKTLPTIYVAQEFFDALPVHVFQRMPDGRWREQLVDVNRSEDVEGQTSHLHFRFVLAPGDTPATAVYGPRYLHSEGPETVELCAEGISIAEELSSRVSQSGGAALIVDYGNDVGSGTAQPKPSLRAITKHKMASVLFRPGLSDVTADVNFSHLRAAVTDDKASFRGSVTQRDFLLGLGAAARYRALGLALVENTSLDDAATDEQLDKLQSDHDRLLGVDAMGKIYRAGAIAHADVVTPMLSRAS
jgi:NADH dehydrogenase [ubiquinone] 1 alpha subcomplex assembly factor 7